MMKLDFNLALLNETSKARWFKTNEIFQILKGLDESNLKSIVVDKLPERPLIGSFFIVDASRTNKKWKQDGHSYIKRNNGIGFREDTVNLKIAGVKEIICSYSYLDNSLLDHPNYPSCRRIYKLANNNVNNTYYLVHYLNEKLLSETAKDKNSDHFVQETPYSGFSTSDDISKSELKPFEEEIASPTQSDFLEKALASDILDAGVNSEERANNFISYNENTKEPNFEKISFNESNQIMSFDISEKPIISNPLQDQFKFASSVDYSSIQYKFFDIESRLDTLEICKPSQQLPQSTGSISNFDRDTMFNIVDYSPEWDYTKGGTKVIICVSPICYIPEALNDRLKISFGEVSVPGYCIQPGVIKCYAPAHTEGFVKVNILIDGESIIRNVNQNLFEYRKQKKGSKSTKSEKVELADRDYGMNNEFKVRLIERVRDYDTTFGPTLESGHTFENQDMFKRYLDIKPEEMEDMDSLMTEEHLLKLLQIFNNNKPKDRETEYQTFLDAKDSTGFALIHYICYLEYNDCLDYLLKSGATPNIGSTSGVTPLEICLKVKNEKMLDILLTNGALGPKKIEEVLQDNVGETGHTKLDIASLFKDRNLIEMILREVSLGESINNSLSGAFPDGENPSESSYFSFFDMLEEKLNEFNDGDGISDRDMFLTEGDASHANDMGERRSRKRNRKYFRNYDKKANNNKENVGDEQRANIDPEIITNHQNQVQLIQKNVRGWLLRRQYLDILHATKVLQNYIRGKTSKKKNGGEEAWDQLFENQLKNQVKNWLKIKE